MPDMFFLVLAGPRERLSSPLNLTPPPGINTRRIWFIRSKLRAQKRWSLCLKDRLLPDASAGYLRNRTAGIRTENAPLTWERNRRDSRLQTAMHTINKRPRREQQTSTQVRKGHRRLAYNLSTLFFCNSGINHLLASSSSIRKEAVHVSSPSSAAAGRFVANR
jgi:hypothetical protein